MRLPTTATAWIAVVTALFWLVAAILGLSDQAAIAMGFIPERMNGAQMMIPAVPAFLTQLSATLAHAGVLHLGFHLLILASTLTPEPVLVTGLLAVAMIAVSVAALRRPAGSRAP